MSGRTQQLAAFGLRLALVMALLAGISGLGLLRADLGTSITLAAGALLLCGIFAGRLATFVGMPRLTGYLLIGIVAGPYVLKFIPLEGVAGLELVKGLAVSLIALAAGTELHLGLIRRVGARVVRLCALVSGVVFVVAMALMLAGKSLIPFLHELSWPAAIAVSAMVASVVVSFSPTVTIAVVQETHARGQFTEFLMSFVIIGDLLVLVAFALTAGIAEASLGGRLDVGQIMLNIGWELFGSLLVGAVIGVAVLVYLKRVGKELPVFITGLCFVAAQAGAHAHLSSLLLMLAAGAVIANLDHGQGVRLNTAIEFAGLPVFALFFAAVGAGLKLTVLLTVGPAALVLAGARALAIWYSCRKFPSPEEPQLRKYLWMGLVSQAGVTFGLASLIVQSFPSFGAQVEALILAMVTLNQLAGPVLVRRALQQVNEIPQGAPAQAPGAH